MFVPRNDVESKLNSTYFCSEDGAFHLKRLFVNYLIMSLKEDGFLPTTLFLISDNNLKNIDKTD